MQFLRSFSCLGAGLFALSLGADALAATPGFVARAGRFEASGGSLDVMARRLADEQLPGASSLTLDKGRVVTLTSGERIVKLRQMHQGLTVVDRGVSVTFGAGNVARLVTASLEDDLPSSIVPALSAADAALIAQGRTHLPADPARAVLAIWPTADGAKLVWGLDSAPVLGLPYAPVVIVDAQNGEILFHYNAIYSLNLANAFPSNPLKSPSTIEVTLPVDAGNTTLLNERVQSLNCIDQKSLKSIPGIPIKVHTCDLLQTAVADANGDFLLPPAGDKEPEDAFAEVSMFYHANRAYDFFRGFDPTLNVNGGKPFPTVSNLRVPDGLQTQDPIKLSNPDLPLVPFQNAFFAPENPLFSAVFGLSGGAMWFGQGPLKDYSYDGDVIYHELVHAVIAVTLKLSPNAYMDAFGASMSPGAMGEGLADYFSSALTGDGDVGEYASQDFAPGSKAIRSLTNPDACPADVGGEVHQDATMFSGALWDVRVTLNPEQQALLDGSVFSAMNSAPTGKLAYEDFAKLALAAVEASPLGKPVSDALTAAFTARGLLPQCQRILKYSGETLSGPKALQGLWFAPGTQTTGVKTASGYTPGVIQVQAAVAEKAGKLIVTFTQIEIGGGGGLGGGGTPFVPKVLVRFGADPIQFKYKPLTTSDDVSELDPVKMGGKWSAEIEVPLGATNVFAMIVSTGQTDGAYTALSFTTEELPAMGTGGAGGSMSTTTASTTTGSGGGDNGPEEIGGCGCATPGKEPVSGGPFAALAALGLVAARRRQRTSRI